MRPKQGNFELKPEEMLGLNWYVLSGCTREEAFIKFVRPDFLGSKAQTAIKAAVQQFFAMKNVQDYLDAYKKTIEDLLSPKATQSKPTGSMEERKARAKAKAMEFAMDLADHIDEAQDPEFVMKMLDKTGILEGDEQVEEEPRRYLPVSPCLTGCAYRMFCEENTEDMCQFCKYHKFGEDSGVHYDKTEMLDVPPSSGTELDSK